MYLSKIICRTSHTVHTTCGLLSSTGVSTTFAIPRPCSSVCPKSRQIHKGEIQRSPKTRSSLQLPRKLRNTKQSQPIPATYPAILLILLGIFLHPQPLRLVFNVAIFSFLPAKGMTTDPHGDLTRPQAPKVKTQHDGRIKGRVDRAHSCES